MSSFDKWLNRLTSMSQLLLVVIAAVTIRLTVIPLYQKELNSEELAKAQIKLSMVQAETDSLNKAVADKEARLADTVSRLQGAERAELKARTALGKLNEELLSKSKALAVLKSQNAKIMTESATLREQVVLDNQLRFRQALEWFSMISDVSSDCYYPGLSNMFRNDGNIKEKTEKGCGPYFSLKNGISTLRESRRDAAGDPLNIPNEIFERWLNIADQAVEKNKLNLRSSFNVAVHKSLDSENIVKKEGEDDKDYLKRIYDMDNARRKYSSKASSDDLDAEKNLIRNLDLSSG